MANNPRSLQNLTTRPAKPSLGRGPLQMRLKRLAEAVQRGFTTREAMDWAGVPWPSSVKRALISIGAKRDGRVWVLDGSESGSKREIDE
jgi:hypothetical protein